MKVEVCDGLLRVEGACMVEDAEPLLATLQDQSVTSVDLSGATHMHMAVIQLIVAAQVELAVLPPDPFLADLLFLSLAGGERNAS